MGVSPILNVFGPRVTWVFLLKHKSEVSVVFPIFFSMVKTQFGVISKDFSQLMPRSILIMFLLPSEKGNNSCAFLCQNTTISDLPTSQDETETQLPLEKEPKNALNSDYTLSPLSLI